MTGGLCPIGAAMAAIGAGLAAYGLGYNTAVQIGVGLLAGVIGARLWGPKR